MQETQVRSLDQGDLLWEEKATHSSVLAWKISWTEKPGRLSPQGCKVRHDWATEHAYTRSPKIHMWKW